MIALDGLEYRDEAAVASGTPYQSWRNTRIQRIRKDFAGTPWVERRVTDYIIFHDGEDTRPSSKLE